MNAKHYAKHYGGAGLSVIPCKPKAKEPVLKSWKRYQTERATEKELDRWFSANNNLAIVTGEVSGHLLVVDFDDPDVFVCWSVETGIETATVETGNGFHCYFHLTDGMVKNWKFSYNGQHGGELRYNGGYVLAPPSIHPNGKQYAWIKGTPGITSVSFGDLQLDIHEQAPPRCQASLSGDLPSYVDRPKSYCDVALCAEASKIRQAGKGARNSTLFTAGIKLKKYISVLGEDYIKRQLSSAAIAVGLPEPEINRTLASAWRY